MQNAESNRNQRRDKKSWKKKFGMRINKGAKMLAQILMKKRKNV